MRLILLLLSDIEAVLILCPIREQLIAIPSQHGLPFQQIREVIPKNNDFNYKKTILGSKHPKNRLFNYWSSTESESMNLKHSHSPHTVGPLIMNRLGQKNECLQGYSRLCMIRCWSNRKFERTLEFRRWYVSSVVFVDLMGCANCGQK